MRQHRFVAIVMVTAALLAAGAVVACDRWVERGTTFDPDDEMCMGVVGLCGLMGLPIVTRTIDATDAVHTPCQMSFLRHMADLSGTRIPKDNQRYEVWTICFDTRAKGWPFITSGREARVIINNVSVADEPQVAEFWVEEPRSDWDRWFSILANWAVYFAAILPLVFGGSWAIHWLRRRFGQRVRAFPVVVVEEGHG